MPLYEEKLINPLAVRFTQEHIRTTFRDGRPVEPTVGEIEALPGDGDYDVILRAPFPHIEIVRWSPPNHDSDGADTKQSSDDAEAACAAGSKEPREHHWFTLDNRRLYCLQRAAVALLPKRAAAVVEILYADPGAVRRKYDSESQGRSVSVSHSTKLAPIFHWSWQDEVLPRFGGTVAGAYKAHQALAALRRDDLRGAVDELRDPPREAARADALGADALLGDALGDALRRAEEHCRAVELAGRPERSASPSPSSSSSSSSLTRSGNGAKDRQVTPSTTDDDSSSEMAATSTVATPRAAAISSASESLPVIAVSTTGANGKAKAAAKTKWAEKKAVAPPSTLGALRKCLEGKAWIGRRGDTYELSFSGEASWVCARKDHIGTKKFTVSYDSEWNIVWWGTDKAIYTDARDLGAEWVEEVRWYAASDWDKSKVRFAWTQPQRSAAAAAAPPARAAAKAYWKTSAPAAKDEYEGYWANDGWSGNSRSAWRRGKNGVRSAW